MFVVDTNVLVYATNVRAAHHPIFRSRLLEWRSEGDVWYVTWGILYEFLRVSTHPSVFHRPWRISEAWGFVTALLASPGLDVLAETERHAEVAERTFREMPDLAGSRLHDAHTAILMREHGVRTIYTRDAGFRKFPFLEVVDPILPSLNEPRRGYPARAAAEKRRSRVSRRPSP